MHTCFSSEKKTLLYSVLFRLTTTLTSLIGIVAAKFSDKMNAKATGNSNKENINSLITNIFFEVSYSFLKFYQQFIFVFNQSTVVKIFITRILFQ